MILTQYIGILICLIGTGIFFGIWKKSYWAGAFMITILSWTLYFIDKFLCK